jgi:hypothetical protein
MQTRPTCISSVQKRPTIQVKETYNYYTTIITWLIRSGIRLMAAARVGVSAKETYYTGKRDLQLLYLYHYLADQI